MSADAGGDSSSDEGDDDDIANLCVDTGNDEPVFDLDTVKVGDWCLFQYHFDSLVCYVGKVVKVGDAKVTADFLQFVFKSNDNDYVKFTEKGNGVEEADLDQIVIKLENPSRETSKRLNAYLKFPFDFSSYNLGK